MVKTYILAPNQTTAPNDLIRLGHILDDITDIREFEPLNPDDIVPIDKTRTNFKIGFTSSRQKLISGEFGVFAKILGLIGVGAGAGVYDGKDKHSILSCKILETQTFSPNKAYIEKCMKLPDVDNFMQGAKNKAPVYLVTGLKIGRGTSFQSGSSVSRGAAVEAGISVPGAPVEIGPSAGVHLTTAEGESWEGWLFSLKTFHDGVEVTPYQRLIGLGTLCPFHQLEIQPGTSGHEELAQPDLQE